MNYDFQVVIYEEEDEDSNCLCLQVLVIAKFSLQLFYYFGHVKIRSGVNFNDFFQTKSGKELIGFLFNDFLLLTESNKQLEKINFQFLFTKESKMQLEVYKQVSYFSDLF